MEKLYVGINYTQQVGDISVWSNGDVVEILVQNKDLYLPFVVTDANRITQYQVSKGEYIAHCEKAIADLCDSKQLDAKKIIAGKEVTIEQDRRYQTLAKHARNASGRNRGKLQQVVELLEGTAYEKSIEELESTSKSMLQPFADMDGRSVEEYANRIIEIEYIWSLGIDTFLLVIEEFKKIAYDVLEKNEYTNFQNFWEMMGEAENIGKHEGDLTPEEVIQLVRGQLDELKGKYS